MCPSNKPPSKKNYPSGGEGQSQSTGMRFLSSSRIFLCRSWHPDNPHFIAVIGLSRFLRAGPSTSLDKSPVRVIQFELDFYIIIIWLCQTIALTMHSQRLTVFVCLVPRLHSTNHFRLDLLISNPY